MSRFFIDISFDGTNFSGWQKQKNAISIQQMLEEKISIKLAKHVELVGCGRTDAGVHARQFIAHFDYDIDVNTQEFIYKMNRFLPPYVCINDIYRVVPYAHARYSAIKRTYKYYISRKKNPFLINYSFEYLSNLDVDVMNEASRYLLTIEDFTSFTKLHGASLHSRCLLYECEWREENNMLIFTITANRFTRNMVRSIVGTMIELGKGKITFNDFVSIIDKKNRCMAGESVEAKGLFLEKVCYPDNIRI
jgi:tRNA pseudouridine38-40 synthase